MDVVSLRDAIYQLEKSPRAKPDSPFAYEQAVHQFNSLLDAAKYIYPDRDDIQGMFRFGQPHALYNEIFEDAIQRLKSAIDLRPLNAAGEILAKTKLPEDAPEDVIRDLCELKTAVGLELTKTTLLLAGSIAEALLLERHPDKSNRGPGLNKLVQLARDQRLFGRDTLRNLETLVDYRDLIHPRAEARNQTFRNQARVDTAITALKLLCHELEDLTVRYD